MSDEQQLSRDLRALQTDDDPNPAFADELFAVLQEEAVARRGRSRVWVMLAAAALVGALAVGAAVGSGVIKVPLLIAEATPTPEPSLAPTPSSSPSPTASAESASPTPSPTSPSAVAVDSVVRIVVTDLALRETPGLDGARQGALAGDGTVAFVVAGPVLADGHEWWQLSGLGLPPYSGCAVPDPAALDECPGWFGWVAGREEGGDYWLEPTSLVCPSSPMNIQEFALARGNVERLACNPDGTITVRGWWAGPRDTGDGECGLAEHSSGWLYCSQLNDVTVFTEETVESGIDLPVFLNPAGEVTMPPPGQWVEIVGHLDDPAAQGCDDAAAADGNAFLSGEEAVLACRTELVADSVRPVSGPF